MPDLVKMVEIARARPHREIARRHGFQIVVEHVGFCCRDHLQRAFLAQEVGRQDFDGRGRATRADGANRLRKMLRAAVGEIVAVDRGNDHMGEPELEGRLRDMFRLGGVERAGHAGLDVAERASPRAGVPHDHEGSVLLVPALADIRAAGLLAHRDKAVLFHDSAGVGIAARVRRAHPDPVRFRRRQRIRPVHLFGVTRAHLGSGDGIDENDHVKSEYC
jgi:hypothetical protein